MTPPAAPDLPRPFTLTPLRRQLAAAGAAALALLVYVLTLAPGIDFIDAGELIAVAHTLGIAHPTGYPTFTMLGWLWSHLPLGSAAVRMNLFSAVCTAAAVYVFVQVIWILLGLSAPVRIAPAPKAKQRNGQSTKTRPALPDSVRLALSLLGALAIAFSATVWKTALSVEVYSLHLTFIALLLFAFARAVLDAPADERAQRRRLRLFALLLGLSFTNHMSTIMLAPAFVALWFWKHGAGKASWLRLAHAAPFFFLGLLPYLYLPLRAAGEPALAWGNPDSLERLFWHIRGKQYSVWMFGGAEVMKRQFGVFFSQIPSEFVYVGLLLAVPGIVASLVRHRRTGVLLALLFVTCLFWAVNYDIHDIESYFILAWVVTGIWAAFGAWWWLTVAGAKDWRGAVALAAVAVGIFIGGQWGRVSQRGNTLVDDYTDNMLRSVKPRAVVLSFQWDNWVSASLTRQLVEGVRPDVTVIDKELLRRSWYYEMLQRRAPELYRRSNAEIRAFLGELYKFEHNLPYNYDDIEARYNDVINSIVEKNYADRPVYLTMEVEQHLAPDFRRVPEGLAFRLYREKDLPSPDDAPWDAFAFRPFERTDRQIDALLSSYANMLLARGMYLHASQRYQAAAPYFDRALGFAPGNTTILKWKTRNQSAMQIGAVLP
jgi:hypothetical protein